MVLTVAHDCHIHRSIYPLFLTELLNDSSLQRCLLSFCFKDLSLAKENYSFWCFYDLTAHASHSHKCKANQLMSRKESGDHLHLFKRWKVVLFSLTGKN